eukprot:758071-Hanusia_phi.AAC.1
MHGYAHAHEVQRADNQDRVLHCRQDRPEPLAHHVEEATDAKRAPPRDHRAQAGLEGAGAYAYLVGGVEYAVHHAAHVGQLPADLALPEELPHEVPVLLLHPVPLLLEALLRGGREHHPPHLVLHLPLLQERGRVAQGPR